MEWISVKDKLPELKDEFAGSSESEYVLVVDSAEDQFVACMEFYPASGNRKKERYKWSEMSTGCGCCSEELDVTHWMPLPEPPKDI